MPPVMAAPVPPWFVTLHVIVWFVALPGTTVPVKASGVPAVAAVGTPVIFVAGTKAVLTMILKFCVYGVVGDAPFTIVAVIAAVPALVALNTPVEEFTAAPVPPALDTLHVMVLLVALPGFTVPVRVKGVPAVAAAGRFVMLVTGTNAALTVILKSNVKGVPIALPFAIVALTVAMPAPVALKVLVPVMVAPVVPEFTMLQAIVL